MLDLAITKYLDSQFRLLQERFRSNLPATTREINSAWNSTSETGDHFAEELRSLILHLADSAGTYGAEEISTIARKTYLELKSLYDGNNSQPYPEKSRKKLNKWLSELNTAVNLWLQKDLPEIRTSKYTQQKENSLVYLLLGRKDLEEEVTTRLMKSSCDVFTFTSLSALKSACHKKSRPVVIIVDDEFSETDISGLDTIEWLKKNIEIDTNLIYVSEYADPESRLAAARMGVVRFYEYPLHINRLVHTIRSLGKPTGDKPYRVLIIDNDKPVLELYQTILEEAGLTVKTFANPLSGFAAIDKFRPDVIVVDMYMPGCSGAELVQMIRQDDRWALIPVIFLSGEQDVNAQLDAIALGADDFLAKPVQVNKLVATMNMMARRARKNAKLHNELKNALQENKYQLVTLDQHAIVSTTNVAGRIIEVNDKLCEISGYSRDELIGQNHRILKSNRHDQSFYKELWDTIKQGKVWHGLICNQRKDGDEYWVESTIVPFKDERGRPYKYVSVRTDVTALMESEQRLERSQDFANIGTWDWNIETGELYWSKRIWSLFGYDHANTQTTYENFLAAIHPEDRNKVEQAVKNCVENGDDYDIEHRVVWPDGSVHWLHEKGDVVRDRNGKATHMLGVVQDITQIKVAEEKMIAAREEAEMANQAKSQFLSSMSHELRTPMNAIMGFSQLLELNEKANLTDAQQTSIREITVAGKHLLNLIDGVLDLAKIESGKIALSQDNICINELVSESLQLIMPLALKRGIGIKLVYNDKQIALNDLSVKCLRVSTDETRLKQVILNLMSNAVKYNNDNGRIEVNIQQQADRFHFAVTDTGNGLSPEQQQNLFTAFNRLGAEKSAIEGTGIGLYITRKIIELMKGSIGCDSKEGKGSTFWFDIPLSENKAEAVADNDNKEKNSLRKWRGEKHSILYIEDNPANLRLVEQLIASIPDLHMWSAPEPLLGLELAMEYRPDIILLDINLPGMDGYQVLEQLKHNSNTKHIRVIAVSANAMPADIEKGMNAGFDTYVTKPINVPELMTLIEENLSRK